MTTRGKSGLLMLAAAILLLAGVAAWAQDVEGAWSPPPPWLERTQGRGPGPGRGPGQGGRPEWRRGGPPGASEADHPHISQWLRKHQDLTPEQQDEALASDPEFQKLPPERQKQLRERLRKFNLLPPEKRNRILGRMDAFEHLTPEQQEQARQIFGQVRQMPEERRRLFRRAMRQLTDVDPEQRLATIDSPEFRSQYSDEERGLMRQVVNLGVLPPKRPVPGGEQGPPSPRPDR